MNNHVNLVAYLLYCFLLVFVTDAIGGASITSENTKSHTYLIAKEPIVAAQWYQLNSKVMDEPRKVGVYLPPSYKNDSNKHYPVIYLLDGDSTNLLGLSGVVESLSTDALEKQIPEFIVVAIPNTHRARDLTPTATDLIFKGKELAKIEGSGGADKFLDFFEHELLPNIDHSFRTNQTRVLAGMSFGGLFVGHALIHRPSLFSHYLLADATYVWDENYLNRMLNQQRNNLFKHKLRVFIGLANNDHIGEHGVANLAWGNEFYDHLKSQSSKTFNVSKRYFPDERHGTVMMLAWYYGLIDLFK